MTLATMGADAFAERAACALLATGEKARSRTVETSRQLTAQETRIARLWVPPLPRPPAPPADRPCQRAVRDLSAAACSSRHELRNPGPGPDQGFGATTARSMGATGRKVAQVFWTEGVGLGSCPG